MDEVLYKKLAQRYADRRTALGEPALVPEAFEAALAHIFTSLVALEQVLEDDDERLIQDALGALVEGILHVLHDLSPGWCLRTPRHATGRYQSPSVLTQGVRRRLARAVQYWAEHQRTDALISLELALKSALELASKLDFNPAIIISGELLALKTPKR